MVTLINDSRLDANKTCRPSSILIDHELIPVTWAENFDAAWRAWERKGDAPLSRVGVYELPAGGYAVGIDSLSHNKIHFVNEQPAASRAAAFAALGGYLDARNP